jgi:hypothetical protein
MVTASTLEQRARTGNKKFKKSNQPLAPSGLLLGWDRDKAGSTTTPAAAKGAVSPGDDSMVQYGGLLDDKEDDEIERVAVHKNSIKGGVGKKVLVR